MEAHLISILVTFLVLSVHLISTETNYCSLCSTHVACRPRKGFGKSCGKVPAIVPITADVRQLWLQLHNGMRSIVASGNLQGFPAATQMSLVKWNDELAELALLNAKQCYAHYDQCRQTAEFPRVGQNIQIDREEGKRLNVTQSIYRTAFKWFNEYEKTDKSGIQRYHIPRSIRQRYNRFALMVQDRLRFIGCAAVEFYDHQEDYLKVSWVCNYSVANTRGATVYETGAAASKCPAGKDWDFPNMCFHSLLPAFEPNDRAKSPRYSDASTNRRIRA